MPTYVYLLFAVQAYAVLYVIATVVVADATGNHLNPLNLKRILLEVTGALLRRRRPTLSYTKRWQDVFRLDPDTATTADVEAAVLRVGTRISERRWAYPASQHTALRLLASAAADQLRRRDAYRQHQAFMHRYAEALGQRSGWRRVLGVPMGELDVRAIKQAYRKLAQRAHPDHGGSDAAMARLNNAFAQARQELAFV
jgi:hypothetical protein